MLNLSIHWISKIPEKVKIGTEFREYVGGQEITQQSYIYICFFIIDAADLMQSKKILELMNTGAFLKVSGAHCTKNSKKLWFNQFVVNILAIPPYAR